jgi:multimeric flavodoxin WrbA
MVQAILEKSGHESEFVKLTDLNYSACKGCVQLCAKPQVCMLADDAQPYYQKIKEADAVVLGSPLYFGTVNATMLSFVERFFGYRHVTVAIAKKSFVLVLGGGGRNLDTAEERFRGVLQSSGVKVLDVVKYSSGIPPCLSCGRHKECTIGGLYGAIGKAAHTLDIQPEFFHRWEDRLVVSETVDAAVEKLRGL